MAWSVLPVRSQAEWDADEIGGEGVQHGRGICIAASDPNIAYMAHDIGGIWKCENLLSPLPTWQKKLNRGLHALYSFSVACDPEDPNIVITLGQRGFMTTSDVDGIYVSTDGAESFVKAVAGPQVDAKNGLGGNTPSREAQSNIIKIGAHWYVLVDEGDGAVAYTDGLVGVWRANESDLTTWTRLYTTAGLKNVSNIVATPTGDGFFASTGVGIRKFTIASLPGNPWSTPTQSGPTRCHWITQDPNTPTRYWATRATSLPNPSTGDAGGALYRSTDSGVTWSTLITQGQSTYINSVHAQNDNGVTRLFIVANDGAVPSINRQMKYTTDLTSTAPTWTDIGITPRTGIALGTTQAYLNGGFALYNNPCGVVFHPTNPVGVMFCVANIFSTLDGPNWRWSATTFGGYGIVTYNGQGIQFDPADPDFMVMYLQDTGYSESLNDGRHFLERGKVPGIYGHTNMYIGHYDGAGIIVTGSGGPGQSGVFKNLGRPTTDESGWVDITPGPADASKPGAVGTARAYYMLLKHINVAALELGQRRYIVGAYRTLSNQTVSGMTSALWQTMSIAGKGGEVTAENENGVLWALKVVIDAFIPAPPNFGRGVWRSTDDGTNWNANNPMILPIASMYRNRAVFNCHPTDNDVFFALCNRSGHVSGQIPDIGRYTFAAGVTATAGVHYEPLGLIQQIEASEGVLPWNQIAYIEVDPVNPEIMYVGTDGQNVDCIWMTTNLSSPTPTWINISADFPPGEVRSLKVHPRTGDLIVGGMHGIWIRPSPIPRVGELSLNEINDSGKFITVSYSATVSSFTVTVDASASIDPDGTIVSYEWDWGDGSFGTGMITTHTYATGGTKTITLVVTDNLGDTGTFSRNVALA